MKNLLKVLLAGLLAFGMVGCSSSSSNNEESHKETTSNVEPLDLTGVWEKEEPGDSTMIALIGDGVIEVHWSIDDEEYMYWYGTYEKPQTGSDTYSWVSIADEDNMTGLLCSLDSEKEFTYKDGILSYVVTVGGESGTIELVKTMSYEDFKGAIEEMEKEEEVKKESMADNIEVIKEYSYFGRYSSYKKHFYVVKNNNSFDVTISTDTKAYNPAGDLVSVDGGSIDVLGSGEVALLQEYFDTDEDISKYETKWTVEEETYFQSVTQYIELEETPITGGVIVTATNNGNKDAEFVKAYILYLLNGEVVYMDDTYLIDDDFDLKVGAEESAQFTCSQAFDTYEIYIEGRG